MKLKVIGAYGASLANFHLTTFRLNDNIILDAGSINIMELEEQLKIDHIFLTHSHLDHTIGIAFFIDNIFSLTNKTICVYGISKVIEQVKNHIFTSDVWVDFSKLPSADTPRLTFVELEPFKTIKIDDIRITPLLTEHIVESSGFLIEHNGSNLLYTGDMIEAPQMWEYTNKLDHLDAMIIEVSFPDRLERISRVSKHLSPRLLREELKNNKHKNTKIFIYHIKPMFIDEIVKDLFPNEVDLNLHLLYEGEIIDL